jgi:glycerone phosphate O-acyltransferase/fatty acyl-CoA reductase
MLGLGYYRNKILHWFHQESVLACTYHALSQKQKHDATFTISLCLLLDHACFLYEMLWMEFVRQDCTQDRMELQQTLDQMSKSNKEDNQVLFVLLQEQDKDPQKRRIVLAETSYGKTMYALLCTLMWPFIDSYWVAVMSLFALRQPNVDISMEELLKRMQWLAETMYHEKIISFYESCSLETLENAIQMLEKAHVIEFFTPSKENKNDKQKTTTKIFVRLAKPFLHQPQSSCSPRHTMNTTTLAWKTQSLEELAAFIGQFRKLPAIFSDKNEGRESQLIASLPALARL